MIRLLVCWLGLFKHIISVIGMINSFTIHSHIIYLGLDQIYYIHKTEQCNYWRNIILQV